jgi:hypothetical protein
LSKENPCATASYYQQQRQHAARNQDCQAATLTIFVVVAHAGQCAALLGGKQAPAENRVKAQPARPVAAKNRRVSLAPNSSPVAAGDSPAESMSPQRQRVLRYRDTKKGSSPSQGDTWALCEDGLPYFQMT